MEASWPRPYFMTPLLFVMPGIYVGPECIALEKDTMLRGWFVCSPHSWY